MQSLPPPPSPTQSPGPHSFDTSSQALREWLQTLPKTHMGELARRLHQALVEVSGLRLSSDHRFEFLERIGQPMSRLLPMLRSHFSTQSLPLSGEALAVAELSDELLERLFNGYRMLLEEPRSLLNRVLQRRMRSLVIHRMLRYGSALLSNHRMLDRPAPQGLWHELHRLFLLAAREGRLRQRAGWFDHPEHESSLADEYKRMLLLAMLDSRHLNAEQQAAVHAASDDWLEGLRLVKFAGDDDEALQRGRFIIELDGDEAPRPINEWRRAPGHGELLLLDSGPLERDLLNRLAAAGDAPPQAAGRRLCRDTLNTLLVNWCRPPRRPRDSHVVAQLRCLIGIGAIYHHLQELDGAPLPRPELGEWASPREHDVTPGHGSAPSAREMLLRRERERAVWSLDALQYEPSPSWSQQIADGHHQEATEFDAEVLEMAEGERCLALPRERAVGLRIGQLAACHSAHSERWRLLQFRWLRRDGEQLLAGAETLLEAAFPALVRLRNGPLTPCIWGLSPKAEALLLLPAQLGFGGVDIQLDYHGHTSALRLLRQCAESAHFDAWQMGAAEGGELPGELEALRQRLGG